LLHFRRNSVALRVTLMVHCRLFILVLFLLIADSALSQCATPINSFPYLQDFELDNGGWVRENDLHWSWGTISGKPVIHAAASGTKCWVAGSLTSNSYNSGTSAVTSPCFDISSLTHPEVGFHVFWETERRYDGATLQYSIDNGSSWSVLGSVSSNQNCQGENWFNQDPVDFVGMPGWSGNVQPTSGSCQGGNGSGMWLNAKHSLEGIGGSHVIFRFIFGAGTICNDFDGFAFDDFYIREAPPNNADFTSTCTGSLNASFTPSIDGCITAVNWDFGDPASGTGNASTQTTPVHQFSGGGTYNVTLTVSFNTGGDVVVSHPVTVLDISTQINQPLLCSGDANGSISLSINPPGSYDIVWNTSPPQTTTIISGLGAGTYIATVSGTNLCSSSISTTLTAPSPLQISTNVRDAYCNQANGFIITQVSGGTAPYQYQWNNGSHAESLIGIFPGTYELMVTDLQGCSIQSIPASIENINRTLTPNIGRDTSICPGQTLNLYPGSFATYLWQNGDTGSHFSVNQSGNYSVTVTDTLGCTGAAAISVQVDCPDVFFPNSFTPNNDWLNDGFGPWGGLNLLSEYRLNVFGRWGELIFTSTDPYKKWNGSYKSSLLPSGTYTWYATYRLRGIVNFRKGTITLIR